MIEYEVQCHSCGKPWCLQDPEDENDQVTGSLFKMCHKMQVCVDCYMDYCRMGSWVKEW